MIDIYRNTASTKLSYSIRSLKTKKVIGHTNEIIMGNVSFIVSESGRKRVIREKKKNVHAVIRGTWIKSINTPQLINWLRGEMVRIYYNPYTCKYFETAGLHCKPVHHARCVIINRKGVWALL